MISDLSCSSSKTSDERLRVAKALLRWVREPAKSIIYTETNSSTLDLVCYVDASYNQTESGVRFNVRRSMCGLMCNKGKFSPVQWKTAELKKRCASVKSAELFALYHGAGQLSPFYRVILTFFNKFDVVDWLTDNYRLTTISQTNHGQNEPTLARQY